MQKREKRLIINYMNKYNITFRQAYLKVRRWNKIKGSRKR